MTITPNRMNNGCGLDGDIGPLSKVVDGKGYFMIDEDEVSLVVSKEDTVLAVNTQLQRNNMV